MARANKRSFLGLSLAIQIAIFAINFCNSAPLSAASVKEQLPVHMAPIVPIYRNAHIQIVETNVTSNRTCSALPSGMDIAQIVFQVLKRNEKDFTVAKKISIASKAAEIDPSALKIQADIDVTFDETIKPEDLQKSRSFKIWSGVWLQSERQPSRKNLTATRPLKLYCDDSLNREIVKTVEAGAQKIADQVKENQHRRLPR